MGARCDRKWGRFPVLELPKVLFVMLFLISCCECSDSIDFELKNYVDGVFSVDQFSIMPGIGIEKTNKSARDGKIERNARKFESLQDYVQERMDEYTRTHVMTIDIPRTARFFSGSSASTEESGKSSFLTGFGMGFLAFGLKKLLLPVLLGAQLIKSVLIAMFLPSILGSVGKILGKGLSSFSGVSGASTGINNNNHNQIDDFDFKDVGAYNNNIQEDNLHDINLQQDGIALASSTLAPVSANSRFGFGNQRISSFTNNDNYYMRKPTKKTDFKHFHKIPSSSLLLTSYDPFYSPLLSRLDAVFQQLGLGNEKSTQETEKCRERLVCLMYANPAKYAPYSNLVSAQLSRELNELRKPASDNPEILRFFRYMKAAKDGQDGEECLQHTGCPSLSLNQPSPAILTTYNDINKLVQARRMQ